MFFSTRFTAEIYSLNFIPKMFWSKLISLASDITPILVNSFNGSDDELSGNVIFSILQASFIIRIYKSASSMNSFLSSEVVNVETFLINTSNLHHKKFFSAFAIALANNGGTALPICLYCSDLGPQKTKSSGND